MVCALIQMQITGTQVSQPCAGPKCKTTHTYLNFQSKYCLQHLEAVMRPRVEVR